MELIKQTWMTLMANKTRSFLTMFGIAWGLVCLILMTAIGEGMWVAQKEKAKTLGQNIMIVWGGTTSKGGEGVRAGKSIRLTLDDYFLLKQEAHYLQRLSPEVERHLSVKSTINDGSFSVHGVFPDYMQMRTIEVKPGGRVIHNGDNLDVQRVCILGDEVKDQVFNKTQAVGQTVMITGLPYLVIGELVHKDQNSNYSGPDAKMVYVPFYTMVKDFPIPDAADGKFEISNMIVQPRSETLGEAAELQVRKILASHKDFDYLDNDAVGIWNTVTSAKFMYKIFGSMKVFLGTVAVVTLILGGIGIMNIMLLTVQERTREIGLRKSIGATSRNILLQFFAESMALTLFAGLGGIGIGWGICSLVNLLPKIDFFAGLIVTPSVGLMSFGFLGVVGVLSSIYPAFMASILDPIEALRSE
jgi:putative ABC transport system permease protein